MNIDKKQYDAMSPAYWTFWNPSVQEQIDADIEANRKADGVFSLNLPPGTPVRIEQISHEFIFGAHIFNFNQLGTDERNEKYKALYGTLFNSATIAFYWKKFEMEENHPRFQEEFRDTAEYWNTVRDPKNEPHWRRPAVDPVVRFCKSKGIRLHGHPLVWGNTTWHFPEWLYEKLPEPWKSKAPDVCAKNRPPLYDLFQDFTVDQIEKLLPGYGETLYLAMAKRIYEIAHRYGNEIDSWDVCNESAYDFGLGCMKPASALCKSSYGLMPGDYAYHAFKLAESLLPARAKLNINDWDMNQEYPDQIADLRRRSCRIDIAGAQMHLFNPQTCLEIAEGTSDAQAQAPERVREVIARVASSGLPVHLSEITITAPGNDERGQAIQAVIARNLYRLWFSLKPMMGITWWNVVDDCGAPGEPSVSGLFSRDMIPKPAYFALDGLINNEWKTRTSVRAAADGSVSFRGFRGGYRLSWTASDGKSSEASVVLH